MARILILLAAAYLLARGVRSVFRELSGGTAARKVTGGQSSISRTGKLVRCEVCGVHLLEERALRNGSSLFCSENCRREAVTTIRP